MKDEILEKENVFFLRSKNICEELEEYMASLEMTMVKNVKAWLSLCVMDSKLSVSAGQIFLTVEEKKTLFAEVKVYCEAIKEETLMSQWHQELLAVLEKDKVTRMEAVMIHICHGANLFYGKELGMVEAFLTEVYTSMYEQSCNFLKGKSQATQEQNIALDDVLKTPWTPDEKNFYDRLESQKNALIKELEKAIIRHCATGSDATNSIDAFVVGMQKSLKTAKNRVPALILTEQSYFFNFGTYQAMQKYAVPSYQIVSMKDSGTSKMCMELHEKIVRLEEFLVGGSAPPFHVRCRSVVVPMV